MIVEPGYLDWAHKWRDANPDTLRLVRELVDETPANADAYEVGNAAPPGALRCVLPQGRRVGIAAQVYSLWSESSAGIGDLADVAELARTSGADVLLLSPLHAPRPGFPQQASPYFPSSRQFRNPLHLRVPGIRIPNDPAARIDRDRVWRAKRDALAARFVVFDTDAGFEAYKQAQGADLRSYAAFCARAEGSDHERDVEFHMWLQWLTDRQLAEAANAGAGLIHDIAVGFDPDGADADLWRELIAPGFHVGAPPDEFNTAGQNWGLPPFVPDALARAGYRPIEAALRAAAAHGAGLRIDHVMGLFRLYWIPDGGSPADGVYVRYPARELLDVVARVSQDTNTFVVGEDLGTVEPGVRDVLARRGVLSYKVLWFEDDPPAQWPRLSLASVTTHDLPTIAAKGRSVDEVHNQVLEAASSVIVLTAEDLLGVTEQPNRPGTTDLWNWSRRLPVPISGVSAAFRSATAA